MGESFNNLLKAVREKIAKPVYDSGGVKIVRFEDTKDKRPKSQALQKAHPELYNFLLNQKSDKKFNVGIIHLDAKGEISRELTFSGKEPAIIALNLYKRMRAELSKIAQEIKKNPSSNLGKIDFLTGVSLFAGAERAAEKLGFETFEIDDGEAIKFDSSSHGRTRQTYEAAEKMGVISEIPNIDEREAKIALISRQNILAFLEEGKLRNL